METHEEIETDAETDVGALWYLLRGGCFRVGDTKEGEEEKKEGKWNVRLQIAGVLDLLVLKFVQTDWTEHRSKGNWAWGVGRWQHQDSVRQITESRAGLR